MEIVKLMDQHNIELDHSAYIHLLTACSNVGSIEIGKQLHQRMIEKQIKPSIILNTTLITMYDKCGKLDEAITLIDSIPKEETDAITCKSLIASMCVGGCGCGWVCVFVYVCLYVCV